MYSLLLLCLLTRCWCCHALSPPAAAIESWIDELVIGHNLCPWAARSHRKIVVVETDLDEETEALRIISKEASCLVEPWQTTLCVFPHYSKSLPLFQRLWKRCEFVAKPKRVHVLAFHPVRRDRQSDSECVQFAMRAPLPCIQLLQCSDLELARETRGGGDPKAMLAIIADNEATLEAIGLAHLTSMYQSWLAFPTTDDDEEEGQRFTSSAECEIQTDAGR